MGERQRTAYTLYLPISINIDIEVQNSGKRHPTEQAQICHTISNRMEWPHPLVIEFYSVHC